MSQWGNVNSRHWLVTCRRCGVRNPSALSALIVDSLYCQISSFRPHTTHAQPFSEQLTETAVFRSEKVSASFTVIGRGRPNDWTTLFSERVITWFDCTERPDTLKRLGKIAAISIFFRLCLTTDVRKVNATARKVIVCHLETDAGFLKIACADFRAAKAAPPADGRVLAAYGILIRLFCTL